MLPWYLVVPPPEMLRLRIRHIKIEDEEGYAFHVFPAGSAYRVVCDSLGIEFLSEQESGIEAVTRILQGVYGIKLREGEEFRLMEFGKLNEEKGKEG